jgi:hypothetical protein
LKTTFPVPAFQLVDVLALNHEPPKVQVPLPIRKWADAPTIDVSPEMRTTDETPDPSRTEDPESVSVPVAVSPALEEAPMEMVPAAWAMSPLTAKSNVPRAIVPAHPVVANEDIAALRFTVTIPPPELASKNTALEPLGAAHPLGPPDESAQ